MDCKMPIKINAKGTFSAWVNSMDKLVSFHPVEGFQPVNFDDREQFLCEIQLMAETGYRFQ